jgi:type I restriction enzyme R subunit
MTTQPEVELEAALIDQLQSLKYTRVKIKDQAAMLANLKQQPEIHNGNITLSKNEFDLILNHLHTGTVIERAKILRDKYALKREATDSKPAETIYISFLNCEDWCRIDILSALKRLRNLRLTT